MISSLLKLSININTMRAMIMAAGRGSRMRPLTDHTHKGLLKINNTPLIEHHIKNLANIGIHDIVINVSYLAEQIQTHLGDGRQFGVNIHYSVEPERLDVGGGIINALPLLNKHAFIVINCDVWCDYPLQNLLAPFDALGKLILVPNPNHNLKGDFSLNGSCVTKPDDTDPTYTYAGIAVYKPELFKGFPQKKPQSMLPIFEKAIANKQLQGELYSGLWSDVGTPERLAALQ